VKHSSALPGVRTLLSACALTCAVGAQAQVSDEPEASEGPAEVIISAQRLEETVPEELSRYGIRVERITATQVKNGGYNDIAQTLQGLAPGFYVAPRAGAFDYVDLSFQGSRTGDVLWLVDGVRLNNRLYNTTTPIDTVPAHLVERIEVLEGGQALFYGTQAVAGAVNVVTKAFTDTPDGAVGIGADTNDGKHFNGYFRNAIGGHQFVLYGSSDEADGFRPFRNSDIQSSSTDRERGYDVQNYGVKYAYDFTEAARLSTMYQHTDAELDHAQPKFVASATNERDEDILTAKFDYTPSDSFALYVKGYYHWWDAYYNETDTVEGGPPEVISVDEFWGFKDYGANVLAKFAAHEAFEYFLGYDFQKYSGQDDVLLIAPQSESVQAPFAQIRTTPALLPDVQLALGIRHNMPDKGDSSTVWTASGKWDISPTLFMRGTVGTAFRLPDAYELFAIDPCCEVGNPDLKPEESENLNLSIGGVVKRNGSEFTWEAIGFYRTIDNLIDIVFDDVLEVDTFGNIEEEVKVRGGELVLGAAFTGGISLKGSATFADAKPSGSDDQIQDVPRSHAKLGFDYAPTGRTWGASVNVNHVGEVFRYLGIGPQNFGDYTTLDIGARLFLGAERNHRLGLRLENAFDEEYATRVRQTTPDEGGPAYAYWHVGTPRTLHATYTYQF
jgi:outer membrane cobalamin receptor